MPLQFEDVITEAHLIRDTLGQPSQSSLDKVITTIDQHCRAFIAQSPFVLIASSDEQGNLDVSPKGDPPGFVQVLDERTLAIPDRLGNRRADTLHNIVQTGRAGLLFLVPGKQETLRVNGRAKVVRDGWLREQMAVKGKQPDLVMIVEIDEAFIHCAKCMIRSHLWENDAWSDTDSLPSIAQVVIDHAKLSDDVADVQAQVDESYRNRLY